MPYNHHHDENAVDRNDYTELKWTGEQLDFDTKIGVLSFIPYCDFRSISWKAAPETQELLESYGIRVGRGYENIISKIPTKGFRDLESAEEYKEQCGYDCIVLYKDFTHYVLAILQPQETFDDWWRRVQPLIKEAERKKEVKLWIEYKKQEIIDKGWEVGYYSAVVSPDLNLQLRTRTSAGECIEIYVTPGNEIPLASDYGT